MNIGYYDAGRIFPRKKVREGFIDYERRRKIFQKAIFTPSQRRITVPSLDGLGNTQFRPLR